MGPSYIPDSVGGAHETHDQAPPATMTLGELRCDPNAKSLMPLMEASLRWRPEARGTGQDLEQRAQAAQAQAGVQQLAIAPASPRGPAMVPTHTVLSPSAALSEQSRLALFPEAVPENEQPPMKKQRAQQCACAGHCNTFKHRKQGGCFESVRMGGSKYCKSCTCVLTQCDKPKLKSDFCYKHVCIWSTFSWPWQAVRAARGILPDLLPGDFTTFVNVYPTLGRHLGALIIAIGLKEPTAVVAFAQGWSREQEKDSSLASSWGHDSACAAFRCMAEAMKQVDGTPHKTELAQLVRQGAGRCLGVMAFGRAVGMLQPVEVEKPGRQVLHLGASSTAMCLADTCPEQVVRFWEACGAAHAGFQSTYLEPMDISTRCRRINAALRAVNHGAKLEWSCYVVAHACRKMVAAAIAHDAAASDAKWGDVSMATLEHMMPDVTKELAAKFPVDTSAAAASEMITGRPDQALMLSMWACLFSEADRVWPKETRALEQLLRSPLAATHLTEWKQRHDGVTPCPTELLRSMRG